MTVPPAPTLSLTPKTPEDTEIEKLLPSIVAKGRGALTFADVERIEDVTGMGIYQLFQDITGVGFDKEGTEKVNAKEAADRAFTNFRMTKAVRLVSAVTGLSQEKVCHFTPQNVGLLYRACMEAYVDSFMIYHGADPAEVRRIRDVEEGAQAGNVPGPAAPEAGSVTAEALPAVLTPGP